MKNSRKDIILIGSLLLMGVFFFLILLLKKPGFFVSVSVDGVERAVYSLNQDCEVVIEGYGDGENILVIENGEVYIKEASCPDGLCMHMGKISKSGQSIICLPNRVVIEIIGEKREEIDGISGGVYGKK